MVNDGSNMIRGASFSNPNINFRMQSDGKGTFLDRMGLGWR